MFLFCILLPQTTAEDRDFMVAVTQKILERPAAVQGGGLWPATDFDGAGAAESSRLSRGLVGFPKWMVVIFRRHQEI